MSSIKSKLAVALFAVTAIVGANNAFATQQLTLTDNLGNTVTVLDGGGNDSCLTAGCITFSGTLTGGSGTSPFIVNVTTGLISPPLTAPSIMDLNSVDVSGGAGTLTILHSVNNLNNALVGGTYVNQIGGTTGGSISANSFVDLGNTLNALTTQVCASNLSFGAGAFSGSCSGSPATDGQFALTQRVIVTHTGAQNTSFDYEVIPEPASMLLLGSGLLGLVGWMRSRKQD
jgi:hypothetical protein